MSLDALRERLDPALELYADVILHPAFRQTDVERLRKQRLVQIQREKADPLGMALRVFPRVVFGEGHAYANPWSGSGTEASASGSPATTWSSSTAPGSSPTTRR